MRKTLRKQAFSGVFCAFLARILRVFCMHFRHSIPGLIRRGGREFSAPRRQVFGKIRAGTGARCARLELVVLYAYKKKENAGLRAYKQRIEREVAKSRLAGGHKTVKAGLEATIRCTKLRKIDCFCDLFDPFSARPAVGGGEESGNKDGDVAWAPVSGLGCFGWPSISSRKSICRDLSEPPRPHPSH